MSQNMITNAIVICVFAVGGGAYLSYKSNQADANRAEQAQIEQESAAQTQQKAQAKRAALPRKSGSTVTLRKDPRNGHFWANARVNSGRVHFLVDTGASTVALTLNDAKKSGIKTRDLVYNVPISTAGGRNYAASIKLESVSIGGITIRDVEAMVVPKGLSTSLLGMSYLGELQKVEATRDTLFLRL